MKKEHVFSVCLLLIFWQIAAVSVSNDILIPYPLETLSRTFSLFQSGAFYLAVGSTLLRVARGFLLSFLTALAISILSERFPVFHRLITPVLVITKTIPNISYIVVALIWLGAEGAVSAVSFMILFPVFANAFTNRLTGTEPALRDAEWIYPETFLYRLKYRILPDLVPEMLATGKTAAGLGLKVGIMAEILGQVRSGIGRSMNYSRLNLDTAGIVAWTIVIILLSVAIDCIFDWLQAQRMKEEL